MPSRFEVLIADSEWSDASIEQEVLKKIEATVKKLQVTDVNNLQKVAATANAVICEYTVLSSEVISNLKEAKVIVVYGVGYDNVDVKAATEKGIVVCNIPDFMTYEVADHAMALLLNLLRKIAIADRLVKTGEWSRDGPQVAARLGPLTNLDGKVAGIIGFGRIGRQLAERLQAFHLRVIAYDPYVNKDLAAKNKVELVDIKTLLKESDIISIHTPLSEETYHLIGEKEISLMKRTAVIVNTSRGKVIDQEALINALISKKIAGAGLDVLEKEPPELTDRLLKLENVILTPHIASMSEKSYHNLRRMAAEETARVLMGKRPRHPVNFEVRA